MIFALIVLVLAALFINAFVLSVIKIGKTSMCPTFKDRDSVLLYRLAYKKRSPVSGEIVVFRRYTSAGEFLAVKRIIGVPGDRIEISNGNVYRNGVVLNEPYAIRSNVEEVVADVPKNSFFVLGDNRTDSIDSRSSEIGFVLKNEILGKVLCRAFPLGGIESYIHNYADKK